MFCCKRFLNVKRATSNHVVRGECGRYPMYISSYKKVVKYWCRICNMPDYRFVKKCYNMLLLAVVNGKSNWVSKVKTILYSFGFGYIWERQHNLCNIDKFISEFVFRLRANYEQEWHSSLVNSSKYSSYSCYKTIFCVEFYVKDISISKFRSALSRFRCSLHQLQIETGRYINKPRSERLCKVCNDNYFENEFHFLLICKEYQNVRCLYLPKELYSCPSINNFNRFMSNTSSEIVEGLAMYIFHAMNLRELLICK